MKAFRPIYRELVILYYRWARHDLRLKPMDPGLPVVITRLNDLIAERPHQLRARAGGCCTHACNEGRTCPLRYLHHGNGGHQVSGAFSVRTNVALPPAHDLVDRDRVLLGICGAVWIVLLAWALQAAGVPVIDLF